MFGGINYKIKRIRVSSEATVKMPVSNEVRGLRLEVEGCLLCLKP
jgi:hypothetical protein